MDHVCKLIKNGDKGVLQISDTCYESSPCQHYCIYKTQENKTVELCFTWAPQIVKLLNMGVQVENIILSTPRKEDEYFKQKTKQEIKAHFIKK